MSEQEENIEICLRLLGWRKHPDPELPGWYAPPGEGFFMNSLVHKEFPTFTTWADAGLILDALAAKEVAITLVGNVVFEKPWTCELNHDGAEAFIAGPLSIRSAALAYIRSLS